MLCPAFMGGYVSSSDASIGAGACSMVCGSLLSSATGTSRCSKMQPWIDWRADHHSEIANSRQVSFAPQQVRHETL